MIDFSELVVLILLLPVTLQLIIPLLMLIGFGLSRAVRTVFGVQNLVVDV